jgi:lipoprotein NlpI
MYSARLAFGLLILCAWTMVQAAAQEQLSARELVRDGSDQLIEGKVDASIKTLELAITKDTRVKPYLWQLGIAYYYADRFADGRKIFEAHQQVNTNDVENAVWHFLCTARADGFEAARKNLIPISGDTRIPMKEVHALFAGKGSESAVLNAASAASDSSRRDALCYAHLYLALYEEARGNPVEARKHLQKAAVDFAQSHYMGRIAQLHARLRGVTVK